MTLFNPAKNKSELPFSIPWNTWVLASSQGCHFWLGSAKWKPLLEALYHHCNLSFHFFFLANSSLLTLFTLLVLCVLTTIFVFFLIRWAPTMVSHIDKRLATKDSPYFRYCWIWQWCHVAYIIPMDIPGNLRHNIFLFFSLLNEKILMNLNDSLKNSSISSFFPRARGLIQVHLLTLIVQLTCGIHSLLPTLITNSTLICSMSALTAITI